MKGFSFPALALVPLLLGYFVWSLDINRSVSADSAPSGSTRPDSILLNPDITLFDQNGRVVQRFEGERLESLAGNRWLEITAPAFDLSSIDGTFWNLTASRGMYDQDSSNFHLLGSVKMQRTTGFVPLRLSTDSLSINTKANVAQSRSRVLIESPGHIISANGFSANLSSGKVELTGSVEAYHESL